MAAKGSKAATSTKGRAGTSARASGKPKGAQSRKTTTKRMSGNAGG